MAAEILLANVSEAVQGVMAIDELIEGLEEARSLHTGRLEAAAERYTRENPGQARGSARCTRCGWTYAGVERDPYAVRFESACSWCDDGIAWVTISPVWMDQALAEAPG
jgi:hypothetical protein